MKYVFIESNTHRCYFSKNDLLEANPDVNVDILKDSLNTLKKNSSKKRVKIPFNKQTLIIEKFDNNSDKLLQFFGNTSNGFHSYWRKTGVGKIVKDKGNLNKFINACDHQWKGLDVLKLQDKWIYFPNIVYKDLKKLQKDIVKFDYSIFQKSEIGDEKTETIKKIKLEDTEEFKKAKTKAIEEGKTRFAIAWAQNATPVHDNLWNSMMAYVKERDMSLHVIAGRYKNPTSIWSEMEETQQWWDERTIDYLDANRHNLHKYLQVLSDVKISPTASTPLSGLNGITGIESCIVGHPRQHLKSLPVLDGYPNKLLLSTGAITVPNYTDSKAGKKGEFHHAYGFIVVELDGDDFHIRQVSADDDGNFYDLFHRVKDGVVYDNTEGCVAAILGDIHLGEEDKVAQKATFELLDYMKPEHTMIHDIWDGHSISHHEAKNPFALLEREKNGTNSLQGELDYMIQWLEDKTKYNLRIVRSNHDDFLDRWLINADWRQAPHKLQYLKYATILANGKAPRGIIPYIIEQHYGDKIKTLGLDDSYRILGWELGMHGHIGASGSRGSHTQYKNMNTKNIVGHGHHPHSEDGHKSVGTLTKLRMGYNKGLSNWMHSNIFLYPDGKAQHVHIINGKYCA